MCKHSKCREGFRSPFLKVEGVLTCMPNNIAGGLRFWHWRVVRVKASIGSIYSLQWQQYPASTTEWISNNWCSFGAYGNRFVVPLNPFLSRLRSPIDKRAERNDAASSWRTGQITAQLESPLGDHSRKNQPALHATPCSRSSPCREQLWAVYGETIAFYLRVVLFLPKVWRQWLAWVPEMSLRKWPVWIHLTRHEHWGLRLLASCCTDPLGTIFTDFWMLWVSDQADSCTYLIECVQIICSDNSPLASTFWQCELLGWNVWN